MKGNKTKQTERKETERKETKRKKQNERKQNEVQSTVNARPPKRHAIRTRRTKNTKHENKTTHGWGCMVIPREGRNETMQSAVCPRRCGRLGINSTPTRMRRQKPPLSVACPILPLHLRKLRRPRKSLRITTPSFPGSHLQHVLQIRRGKRVGCITASNSGPPCARTSTLRSQQHTTHSNLRAPSYCS